MTAFPILQKYLDAEQKVFNYFGYFEDWRRLPIVDSTAYFWRVDTDEKEWVLFSTSEEKLNTAIGDYCLEDIYTQRHLSKLVYRGADFTMICVNTHTDGNQFLRVFDNSKERKA